LHCRGAANRRRAGKVAGGVGTPTRLREAPVKLTELFVAELDREENRSRRVLEEMPEGKLDWKPHDRSMAFGYLAELVATMPSWVAMTVTRDELDLEPQGGGERPRKPLRTRADYLDALHEAAGEARIALSGTTDEHLMTPWRLLVAGNVVMEAPRHEVIRDSLNHLAHHRGQMTVYLRLLGAKVPALYGPSADEQRFA